MEPELGHLQDVSLVCGAHSQGWGLKGLTAELRQRLSINNCHLVRRQCKDTEARNTAEWEVAFNMQWEIFMWNIVECKYRQRAPHKHTNRFVTVAWRWLGEGVFPLRPSLIFQTLSNEFTEIAKQLNFSSMGWVEENSALRLPCRMTVKLPSIWDYVIVSGTKTT